MAKRTHKFQSRIYKIWLMRHVDVPEEIGRALAAECARRSAKEHKKTSPKHIPVMATVNAKSQRTTLVPAGGGRYRLQLNTALRKAAQADAGDLIGVSLRYDTESREMELPEELRAALKEHPKAWKEYERLPTGHRRQLLLYYLRAKSEKARAHVTARFIDHLLERAMLGTGRQKAKRK
ncbi:MAG TPA: YdeI/OmpD-associated family protein [Candidatus Aquilonibacter sp.]|nr:YdeI/OmpD-associated family protein [Candidatus Aquilonibacter sp.]